MTKTLFDRSVETLALRDRLRAVPVDSIVSYDDLSAVIGAKIQTHRHFLYSAMKSLIPDGVVFGTVRTVGLRRLPAVDIPTIGADAVRRVRRTSRIARGKMSAINRMNDVDNATRIKTTTYVSMLGVIEHFTGKSAREVTEATVEKSSSVISPLALIDALRSK